MAWLLLTVVVFIAGCAGSPGYVLTPAQDWEPSSNAPAPTKIQDVAPYKPSLIVVSGGKPKDIADEGEAPVSTAQKISISLPEKD